jgi:predicted metalloprotease with PDZ domain
MRALWQRTQGGPMRHADISAVLNSWGLASVTRLLDAWVHSTDALPVEHALNTLGVKVTWVDAPLAQRLGIRVREDHAGLQVTHVLRGGAGEAMGLCAGDEWLSVQVGRQHARVRKLSDVKQWMASSRNFKAWVARDGLLRQLQGEWPAPARAAKLSRVAS